MTDAQARHLRKTMTDAERRLWSRLRSNALGFHFRRQHRIGNYIADFVCLERKLVVEVDGGQHNEPDEAQRDTRRSAYLAARGIKVLRYWNHDVLNRTEAVLEDLYAAVAGDSVPSPPTPLPEGEGRPADAG